MSVNLVNTFNKMRSIAVQYKIYLKTPKCLSQYIEGTDPKELVNSINVNSIKEAYGVDLHPSIENSTGFDGTIYLENIDQLFLADVTKFEEIMAVLGNARPSFTSDAEIDLASLSDIDDDEGFDVEEMEKLLKDDFEESSDEESEEKAEPIEISKESIEKIIEETIESEQMCHVESSILSKFDENAEKQITKLIEDICKEKGYDFSDGMIYAL